MEYLILNLMDFVFCMFTRCCAINTMATKQGIFHHALGVVHVFVEFESSECAFITWKPSRTILPYHVIIDNPQGFE